MKIIITFDAPDAPEGLDRDLLRERTESVASDGADELGADYGDVTYVIAYAFD